MLGNYRVAAQLVGSRVVLISMELVGSIGIVMLDGRMHNELERF
jgi:hypothetical protein